MRAIEERSERMELVTTVLLGVATVASAWCTYQSELWNSEQLELMSKANVIDNESLRATGTASRNAVVDAATFANLLQSESRNDRRAVAFILERARPGFRPFLDDWYARKVGQELPAGTPLEDRRYQAEMEGPASKLRAKAAAVLREAHTANEDSDRFTMRTVILATSLFFLGIAGQLHTRGGRRMAVVFGAVMLILTLLSTTRLRIAPRPSRVPENHTSAPE